MEYLVKMYADLVELKLRAITEQDAQDWGVPIAPIRYRQKVIDELERRQAAA